MKNFLTLSSFLCFGILTHTAFAANCTVTADSMNVNLNFTTAVLITNVHFKNCKNLVRPSFQWTNNNGSYGAFYLNNQPSTSIEVPFSARAGANWDNTGGLVGGSQTAASATFNFNNFFHSGYAPKNMTLYSEFRRADFGDLSKYPAGTYTTSMIFSANEF